MLQLLQSLQRPRGLRRTVSSVIHTGKAEPHCTKNSLLISTAFVVKLRIAYPFLLCDTGCL